MELSDDVITLLPGPMELAAFSIQWDFAVFNQPWGLAKHF